MSQAFMQFSPAQNLSAQQIVDQLKTAFRLSEKEPEALKRIYYDSFDWRLHNAGYIAVEEWGPALRRLVLQQLSAPQRFSCPLQGKAPGFAQDLPAGVLRERLGKILEMRVLLPLCELQTKRYMLSFLGDEEKTLARLWVEENRVFTPNRRKKSGTALPPVVILESLKGYARAAAKVEKFLRQNAWDAAGLPSYRQALQAIGREPGDYSGKLDIHLEPEMPANVAAKTILLNLLETMRRNEENTGKGLDSEFLHDFRVAVRRSRSALSQIDKVLPAREVRRFQNRLGELGTVTGPTRDLDVYLLKYPQYEQTLPPNVRRNLKPLYSFLQRHQAQEQKKLAAYLKQSAYKKFTADWHKFLSAPAAEHSSLANATRPIAEVASERIWKVYRKVLKEGHEIDDTSPAEALHELRKTCKKLRYLMEFFQSLYPRKKITALIKVLKGLQDNLGDFQDYEVQQTQISGFARQMQEEGDVPVETLLAIGMLAAHLNEGQQDARHEFGARFSAFAGEGHDKEFAALFQPGSDQPGEDGIEEENA